MDAYSQPLSSARARFWMGGPELFRRWVEVIDAAQREIHLQMYIYAADATGELITAALERAVQRGVDVWLLVDAYGSWEMPEVFAERLRDGGIRFRWFSPLLVGGRVNVGRRLHHKLLVVDGELLFVGGINVADHYHGTREDLPWLDFAVEVRGDVAAEAAQICAQLFGRSLKTRRTAPYSGTPTEPYVRLLRNDWYRRKRAIHRNYQELFQSAQTEVWIVNSYFLPSHKLLTLILQARKRGVRVRMLLPGLSDVPSLRQAALFYYYKLLGVGVEVYELQTRILHGKLMAVDGRWLSVGSYNLNVLSQYFSLEANLWLDDPELVPQITERLERVLAEECKWVDPSAFRKSGLFAHLRRWVWVTVFRATYRLFSLLFSARTRRSLHSY